MFDLVGGEGEVDLMGEGEGVKKGGGAEIETKASVVG